MSARTTAASTAPRTGSVRARLAFVLCAAVALVTLGACGQKAGNDTSPSTTAPASNERSATAGGEDTPTTRRRTTTSEAPASTVRRTTTTTSGSRSSTTTSTVVAKPSSASYEAFCTTFADLVNEINAVGGTDSADRTAFYATLKERFQRLADTAADEIKSDVHLLNDVVQTTPPEQLFTAEEKPEETAAAKRITDWTKVNCGFDPAMGSSSSSGSGGGGGGDK